MEEPTPSWGAEVHPYIATDEPTSTAAVVYRVKSLDGKLLYSVKAKLLKQICQKEEQKLGSNTAIVMACQFFLAWANNAGVENFVYRSPWKSLADKFTNYKTVGTPMSSGKGKGILSSNFADIQKICREMHIGIVHRQVSRSPADSMNLARSILKDENEVTITFSGVGRITSVIDPGYHVIPVNDNPVKVMKDTKMEETTPTRAPVGTPHAAGEDNSKDEELKHNKQPKSSEIANPRGGPLTTITSTANLPAKPPGSHDPFSPHPADIAGSPELPESDKEGSDDFRLDDGSSLFDSPPSAQPPKMRTPILPPVKSPMASTISKPKTSPSTTSGSASSTDTVASSGNVSATALSLTRVRDVPPTSEPLAATDSYMSPPPPHRRRESEQEDRADMLFRKAAALAGTLLTTTPVTSSPRCPPTPAKASHSLATDAASSLLDFINTGAAGRLSTKPLGIVRISTTDSSSIITTVNTSAVLSVPSSTILSLSSVSVTGPASLASFSSVLVTEPASLSSRVPPAVPRVSCTIVSSGPPRPLPHPVVSQPPRCPRSASTATTLNPTFARNPGHLSASSSIGARPPASRLPHPQPKTMSPDDLRAYVEGLPESIRDLFQPILASFMAMHTDTQNEKSKLAREAETTRNEHTLTVNRLKSQLQSKLDLVRDLTAKLDTANAEWNRTVTKLEAKEESLTESTDEVIRLKAEKLLLESDLRKTELLQKEAKLLLETKKIEFQQKMEETTTIMTTIVGALHQTGITPEFLTQYRDLLSAMDSEGCITSVRSFLLSTVGRVDTLDREIQVSLDTPRDSTAQPPASPAPPPLEKRKAAESPNPSILSLNTLLKKKQCNPESKATAAARLIPPLHMPMHTIAPTSVTTSIAPVTATAPLTTMEPACTATTTPPQPIAQPPVAYPPRAEPPASEYSPDASPSLTPRESRETGATPCPLPTERLDPHHTPDSRPPPEDDRRYSYTDESWRTDRGERRYQHREGNRRMEGGYRPNPYPDDKPDRSRPPTRTLTRGRKDLGRGSRPPYQNDRRWHSRDSRDSSRDTLRESPRARYNSRDRYRSDETHYQERRRSPTPTPRYSPPTRESTPTASPLSQNPPREILSQNGHTIESCQFVWMCCKLSEFTDCEDIAPLIDLQKFIVESSYEIIHLLNQCHDGKIKFLIISLPNKEIVTTPAQVWMPQHEEILRLADIKRTPTCQPIVCYPYGGRDQMGSVPEAVIRGARGNLDKIVMQYDKVIVNTQSRMMDYFKPKPFESLFTSSAMEQLNHRGVGTEVYGLQSAVSTGHNYMFPNYRRVDMGRVSMLPMTPCTGITNMKNTILTLVIPPEDAARLVNPFTGDGIDDGTGPYVYGPKF